MDIWRASSGPYRISANWLISAPRLDFLVCMCGHIHFTIDCKHSSFRIMSGGLALVFHCVVTLHYMGLKSSFKACSIFPALHFLSDDFHFFSSLQVKGWNTPPHFENNYLSQFSRWTYLLVIYYIKVNVLYMYIVLVPYWLRRICHIFQGFPLIFQLRRTFPLAVDSVYFAVSLHELLMTKFCYAIPSALHSEPFPSSNSTLLLALSLRLIHIPRSLHRCCYIAFPGIEGPGQKWGRARSLFDSFPLGSAFVRNWMLYIVPFDPAMRKLGHGQLRLPWSLYSPHTCTSFSSASHTLTLQEIEQQLLLGYV